MPRLNFTRRRTIDKQDVRLLVDEDAAGELRIRGHIAIGQAAEFPESSSVQLYVCRSPYLRRSFPIGPVRPRVDVDLAIGSIPDARGLRADVRVVETADPARRILAICRRCRMAGASDETDRRTGLLGVRRGDFDLPLWRLALGEIAGDGAWLEVSRKIPDYRSFARRPEVQSLVIPDAVRSVAWKILVEDNFNDEPDEDTHAAQWVSWFFSLPGVGEYVADASRDVREGWVDDICEAFCKDCDLLRRAATFLDPGDE